MKILQNEQPTERTRRLAVRLAKAASRASHAAACRGRGEDRQGPLFLKIAAFRAQGRLSQLSAKNGLYVEGQSPSRGRNLLVGWWRKTTSGRGTTKLPCRKFLRLAAGAATLAH